MRESGIVKKIDGKFVVVGIEMHEGCESCMNSTACKTGRSALQTLNPKELKIAEGDQVEIEIRSIEQAKSAFWVLGLPLIALFAGYGIGRLLFPSSGEGPAVACAGLLFVATMALGIMVQKGQKLDSLPVVTRKLGE